MTEKKKEDSSAKNDLIFLLYQNINIGNSSGSYFFVRFGDLQMNWRYELAFKDGPLFIAGFRSIIIPGM